MEERVTTTAFYSDSNKRIPTSSPQRNPTSSDQELDNFSDQNMEDLQRAAGAPGIVGSEPIPAKSLVIKTNKPRPYACPTCTRSFARLEHLKRHERSHTKEKPFQCPICERSFARRDLLLRHKQKLHASFSPPDDKAGSKEGSVNERPGQILNGQSNYQQSMHSNSRRRDGRSMVGSGLGASSSSSSSSSPSPLGSRLSQQLPQTYQDTTFAEQNFSEQNFLDQSYTDQNYLNQSYTDQNFNDLSYKDSSYNDQNFQKLENLDLLTPLRSASPQSINNVSSINPYTPETQMGFPQQVSFSQNDTSKLGNKPLGNSTPGQDQFNEWKQLNPLAHELEILQTFAPPFHVASRASRASSFSAASATSYVRQKDLAAIAPTSAHFSQGPSEVGFATPQTYAVDDGNYDFEPLDLNFVSPAQLSHPPPRKRRVSVSTANSSVSVGSPLNDTNFNVNKPQNPSQSYVDSPQTGPAMLALRAQVRSQRQLYHHLGTANTDSAASLNSVDSDSTGRTVKSVSPPQIQGSKQSQQQAHQQATQQQHISQHEGQMPIPGRNTNLNQGKSRSQNQSPSQNMNTNHSYVQHQSLDQNMNMNMNQNANVNMNQNMNVNQQTSQLYQSQPLDDLFSGIDGSYSDYNISPTPGMTPGMTPFGSTFTPGMHAPSSYQPNSISPLPEETGDIKEFLNQQNDDFVNSLFDAEGDLQNSTRLKHQLKAPPATSSVAQNGVAGASTDFHSHNNENTAESTRMQRNFDSYIDSYFNGFDTHLSFVHRPSQSHPCDLSSISSGINSPAISPPSSSSSIGTNGDLNTDAKLALSQAQAAVGAQILGERGEAQAYYWAARDHNNSALDGLEGLQADLLVAILGLFFDEPSEHAAGLNRLAVSVADSEMIAASMVKSHIPPFDPQSLGFSMSLESGTEWSAQAEQLWESFISNQSRVRSLYALFAVCCWVRRPSKQLLQVLENSKCLPSDDDLWRAGNSDMWLRLLATKGLDARTVAETGGSSPLPFASALAQLRSGEVPSGEISPFTLQTLLMALQLPTTSMQSPNFVSSRAALRAWESLWARSPNASLDPSPLVGPVMSDCVGIVSLVAFSPLKMDSVLDALWKHDFQNVSAEVANAIKNQQQGLSNVANYAVDTLVWCEGHVTSSTIFFTTLLAVTECGLVLSESLRQINAKNTPLTPSEEQLIQRSRKLVSSVLKAAPSADLIALSNGILRAAVCLVKLSDWPLVGALSRTLLAHAS